MVQNCLKLSSDPKFNNQEPQITHLKLICKIDFCSKNALWGPMAGYMGNTQNLMNRSNISSNAKIWVFILKMA